jgi:lactate dehydrogenase-like 2-hydroxyacid dehydrogenase
MNTTGRNHSHRRSIVFSPVVETSLPWRSKRGKRRDKARMSTKPEILAISALPADVETQLDDAFTAHRFAPPLDDIDWSALANVRGILTGGGTGAAKAWIERLPALEVIAVNGVGTDKIDFAATKARGIGVANTPDLVTADVADLAIGLLVDLSRRMTWSDRFVREGRWKKGSDAPLTRSLSALRVGILGLGNIGMAIATRCAPMVKSIAYHNRKPREDAPYPYVETLEALAAQSDVLFVAAVGNALGLVSARVIDALGPKGMLINISRGGVIDEDAMVAALVHGKLGGAALDVFAQEPSVPAELLKLENVVLLPHIGTATVETRRAMGQLALDNLKAHFAGKPLLTPVI